MSIATEVWDKVLDELRNRVSPVAMSAWFEVCSGYELTDNEFILFTPKPLKAKIIEQRWKDEIMKVVTELLPGIVSIKVLSDESKHAYEKSRTDPVTKETLTFENFIVGNQNKLAHGAARAVAKGAKDYNPLYIYGNSGLGKTHLLRAIKYEVSRIHPEFKIVYVTSEMFLNDIVSHLQSKQMQLMREKYRTTDLWLVDDIQFIAGKEGTEEEFFNTYNELFGAQKQIVLTSDRMPREIRKLESRLKSRFEQGLVVDIKPPDFETRVAIVYNKAKQLNFNINSDIAVMIAETLTSNIRQLEGAVKTLHAMIGISGNESQSYAEIFKRLKDTIRDSEREINAELIINETASYFGIKPEDLRGKSRVREINHTRQIAWYLIREMTGLPYENIGDILGNRDHATVMSGVKNIQQECDSNETIRDQLRDLRHNITTRASEL